ncbi:MAG: hypothetical protein HY791_36775 [Deltaproteobacteria bacterium]|nr:hypothetical protein [Deltaproteobacteria bacterium]
MAVRTRTVASRIIGEARASLEDAAGSNQIISKREAKKLPSDLAAAVDKAREESSRVTVEDAVDVYASQVSRTLAAVDKRGKGTLSEAEANRIYDPSLRKKALDVRAEMLAGGAAPVTPPSSGSSRPTSAEIVAAIGADPMPVWHESGDNGVNTNTVVLTGMTSLAKVMAGVTQHDGTPWTEYETKLELTTLRGAAAIESFLGKAKAAFEGYEIEGSMGDIAPFLATVEANFSKLSSVRLLEGGDFGGSYLVGRAKDCYVSLTLQPYSDG